MRKLLLFLLTLLMLAGCRNTPTDTALGTIEWDRVELVATAAEPITAIAVREGDPVARYAPQEKPESLRKDIEKVLSS